MRKLESRNDVAEVTETPWAARGKPASMMSDVVHELERVTDVLVIGARIAGVVAAAEFIRAGARVLVLDEGRSVGGRLASRRIGEAQVSVEAAGAAEHGATYFGIETRRDRGTAEGF